MKLKLSLLIILSALFVCGCQQVPDAEPVDLEAEKEAILKVIQVESEFARDGKFEEFVELYVQDEYNTRVIMRPDTMWLITGWENLYEEMSYIKDREPVENNPVSVLKENPVIKVTGNSAWIVCDNIWKGTYEGREIYSESVQVTFLEKIDGKWKVSFSSWTYKPVPEE